MRADIGRYRKPNGHEEVRLHFPEWRLPDGRLVTHVTAFPHPCSSCAGGDHTHIEINDTREPIEILAKDAVAFSQEHVDLINRLVCAQLEVNAHTIGFAEYLQR